MTYLPQIALNGSGNTTTTPLASSATFTGTAEQNPFASVLCSCYSDTAGTLYFDFSVNGTDWRTSPSSGFPITASSHVLYTGVKGPRYFRVRFVNSASTQTVFQLYTYYGNYTSDNIPLNQIVETDAFCSLTRPSSAWLDIARSIQDGISIVSQFGHNDEIGTSFGPISDGGIYRTPQASAATALRIKAGGHANDTAAGSGAQEITIVGLDENFDEATESLATNGASASSSTTTTFTRIHKAYVSKAGTYANITSGSHSGDIVIENSSGGTDWATISTTLFPLGQTSIGVYALARNKTCYIFLKHLSLASSKTVRVLFFKRDSLDDASSPYKSIQVLSVLEGITGGSIHTFGNNEVPLGPFTGPCELGFMAFTSTGTSACSCAFDVVLVNN